MELLATVNSDHFEFVKKLSEAQHAKCSQIIGKKTNLICLRSTILVKAEIL